MNQLSRWIAESDISSLSIRDRSTHTYVIGQPGMGKSRALESWIVQDVRAGRGVGVIDPHGDLFEHLIFRLAEMREVWDRLVIIDPCNDKWITTFNPLESVSRLSQERLALFLTDILGKIWQMDVASAPRTMWLLSNSFLALSGLGLTLLDLPRFLLDRDFREGLMPRLTHAGARSYFEHEYPRQPAAAHQWATPVLNKIGSLIFDTDTSLMLAGKSRFSFRQILDRRLVLLVNLPKGILGEGVSSLLGAFIVAHLQKAALGRANSHVRPSFYLYLDEFQNYTTDNIKDILSESRKYSLSLVLVHQYLDQLSTDMRSAVLNTAGSMVCFRVGHQDGCALAKEIFPNRESPVTQLNEFTSRGLGPAPWTHFLRLRSQDRWEDLTRALVSLRPREFWLKRRGAGKPTLHRTFDMPQPEHSTEAWRRVHQMLDVSGRLYSRLKEDVRGEARARPAASSKTAGPPRPNAGPDSAADDKASLWSV